MTGIVKFKSALSYGALCGCAFWALTQSYTDGTEDYWSCSNVTYALITLHAMFGFWKYGRTTSNSRIPKFYKPLSFLTAIYSVPLICVDMYLFNSFTYEIAYLHVLYPLVAICTCIRKKKPNAKTLDLVNFLSLTSLSFISAMSKNYFGLGAACTHAVANYVIREANQLLGIGAKDCQNYFMAAFVYLSLRSLVLAETRWVSLSGPTFSFF